MFNSRIIRIQDAELHFEVMAYLIRKFGPPPRPHVHSPLHTAIGLETLAWTPRDTRTATDWADDNFAAIQTLCHMDEFDVRLAPVDGELDMPETDDIERIEPLDFTRLSYDRHDQPQPDLIFFDPRNSAEPGHFVATILFQLAELRLSGFQSKSSISGLMQRMATLSAAVYNRQGFVLANLPDHVSAYLTSPNDLRAVPLRLVINNLCFATCLALRIRQQSNEQIIATYGMRMTKSFRRKINQACHQIDSYAEELAILQLLAAPKAQQRSAAYQSQLSA